eukprot:4925775-Pleurochrysis_carterae.AAC.1
MQPQAACKLTHIPPRVCQHARASIETSLSAYTQTELRVLRCLKFDAAAKMKKPQNCAGGR